MDIKIRMNNCLVKLNLKTLTPETFSDFSQQDLEQTDDFFAFMKYFYYYLNEPNIKTYVMNYCPSDDSNEYWFKLNININKDYWSSLVDGKYVSLTNNITKKNIQEICNNSKAKDALDIVSMIKICSELLTDNEGWGVNMWIQWANKKLKDNKINSLWKECINIEQWVENPTMFYNNEIGTKIQQINNDKKNQDQKVEKLKNRMIPKITKKIDEVSDVTSCDQNMIKLLATGLDKDAAIVLNKLEGSNIVCVNSKSCLYYVFNNDNKLWEEKTENLLLKIISDPLIQIITNYINIIEQSIFNTSGKEKSELEETLKKLTTAKHQFGKAVFIEKIIKWIRSETYNENFLQKLNKITHYLPIKDNLVINLKTKQTEPRLKIHYFTFHSDIRYGNVEDEYGIVPDYTKEIQQFYLDIAGGDVELYHFYQRLFGLSLTGEVEKLIFIIFGKGNNGKSCIMRILKRILGPPFYATLNKAIFIEAKGSSSANSHTSYLQSVMNSRVGVAGEVTEEDKLNTSLLKSISGYDGIVNRACGSQKEEEFNSQATLIIPVNEIPSFPPRDQALIDRIVVAPAITKFIDPVYTGNSNVLKKLEEGHRYKNPILTNNMEKNPLYLNDIFKWMVEGAYLYYKEGISIPKCAVEAKKHCLINNDKLQQFLDENLIKDEPMTCVKVKDVLYLYQDGGRININPNEVTKFCKELRQRGYKVEPKGKTGDNRAQHLWGYYIEDPLSTIICGIPLPT